MSENTDDQLALGANAIPNEDEGLEISPEEMGIALPDSDYTDPEANSEHPVPPQPAPSAEPEGEPQPEEPAAEDGAGEPEAGSEATEEEPSADDDPDGTANPEPEPEPSPDTVKVPKARLDKALRDKRALENRIQQLEQQMANPPTPAPASQPAQEPQQQPPSEPELVNPKEIAEALLEGDMDKYVELTSKRDEQIRSQVRQDVVAEVNTTVPQHVTEQQRRNAYNEVLVDLETRFPMLDPNSDQYDDTIVGTVAGFANSFVAKGYTPADALAEAADKVMRIEKPDLFRPAPEKPGADIEKLKKDRLNIDQKLKAAQAQPPAVTGGEIKGDPVPDVMTMSEEDFDKLSDKELDELTQRLSTAS